MLKVNNIQGLNGRFIKQRLNNDSNTENKTNLSFTSNVIEGKENAVEENDKEKKSKLSFKKITNILGTLAGVGIILSAGIYNARRPKWMKILNKEKGTFETKIKSKKEQMEVAIRVADGKEQKGGMLYRFGASVQNIVNKVGDELSNNILYAIGTLAIMPLVIMFSPFGKKDSSKEDKFFAVIRQPISFATMFSIQLTNDKVFSRWAKSLEKQNWLEDKDIVDSATRKIIKGENGYSEEVISKIKYNSDVLKEHFEQMFEKAGFKTELLKNIYKIKDPQIQKNKFKEVLEAKATELNVPAEKTKELVNSFSRFVEAGGKRKLITESIKIVSNVLVSQVIGCTLLNVIYGKIMKGWTQHKEAAVKNNINNQVQNIDTVDTNNKEGKVA